MKPLFTSKEKLAFYKSKLNTAESHYSYYKARLEAYGPYSENSPPFLKKETDTWKAELDKLIDIVFELEILLGGDNNS